MKKLSVIGLLMLATFASVTKAGESSDTAASTQPVMVKLLPGPFELPVGIGKLLISGQPHVYDDPRGGISYAYGASGMMLTVYVYDAGIKDIPDGGNSRLVCELSESAKQDVRSAGYNDVQLKSEQMVRLSDTSGEPMIRESVFEFDTNNSHRISYVWITGAAKYFVKLRFTTLEQFRGEVPALRNVILSSVIAALLPHIKQLDPKTKTDGHSINVAINSPNMEDGFMYLGMLGVLADKQPANVPVCGGVYIPDFDVEYGAYQGLLQLNQDSKSTLMKQLRKINDAGFLAEFVWVKLHQDKWGTSAPEALKLAEFDIWQKKNLKKFEQPYFGSISYDYPRPISVVNLK